MNESSERFLVREWLDGCAVFDLRTGNTHALDLPSCKGFLSSLQQLNCRDAILAEMKLVLPNELPDKLAELAQASLERLEMSGLIEPEKRN